MPAWQMVLNVPFIAAGIIIKTVYFARKGLVTAYLKGIVKGLSGKLQNTSENEGGKHKNTSFATYLGLQMWLFRGLVQRVKK